MIVSVFGGTGFIGRNLIPKLVKLGFLVKVASRNPQRAHYLKVSGNIGQIEIIKVNVSQEESVREFIKGSDIVINLIGILNETRKQKFNFIHSALPSLIAQLTFEQGIKRFIHLSALGSDVNSESRYSASKANGEVSILNYNSQSTIIKPSLVYGPDDNFFNQFASILSIIPIFPLIGYGKTKFQPIYVGDLVELIIGIIEDVNPKQIYEAGGDEVYSLKEIIELILGIMNRKRLLIPVPFNLSKGFAIVSQFMPKPLITFDQLKQLQQDNIISYDDKNLVGLISDFGITPKSVKNIVPLYLKRFSKSPKPE